MENKYVRVGNGVLYIHNPEEHGVTVIPIKDFDTLINELIQIKRRNDNKN